MRVVAYCCGCHRPDTGDMEDFIIGKHSVASTQTKASAKLTESSFGMIPDNQIRTPCPSRTYVSRIALNNDCHGMALICAVALVVARYRRTGMCQASGIHYLELASWPREIAGKCSLPNPPDQGEVR